MDHQLDPGLLSHAELKAAAENILEIAMPLVAHEPFLKMLADKLEQDVRAINEALDLSSHSEHTAKVTSADSVRDSAFVYFHDHILKSERLTEPEFADKSAAASRVMEGIAKRGSSLHKLRQMRQSSEMKALFAELDSPEMKADLKLLEADVWLERLIEAQTEFEKVAASGPRSSAGTLMLSFVRNSLSRRLTLLLDALDEWHHISPTAELDEASKKLDLIISEIMNPARARRSAKGISSSTSLSPVP